MILEIKLPSPGESISEVQIAKWIKQDGDYVEKDEEIAEIDSDKATLALTAEADGVIKILVKEGETAAVGAVACTIDTEGKKAAVGSQQEAGKESAVASKQSAEENKSAVGSQQLAEEKNKSVAAEKSNIKVESSNAQKSYADKVPSVAAEKMMKEKNITDEDVQPTGKGGRITKADVITAQQNPAQQSQEPTPQHLNTSTPQHSERKERREKMTMLRKKIAQRLVAVKNETAMLTTFNEVDMSGIMNIRKLYKDVFKEKHGVGLGFMSFFTKAVTEALKAFPVVNARIEADEIIYHDYADIGIAVSAPKGLMVPIIRNAESMSLAQIESIIIELASKARDNKLSIEEMSGGTFTITNGGVFGSMMSTPIINPPQSAILGMHNIVERPVVVNGQIVIRPMMYVAVSYDHRIIDGRESVGFLVKVKQMLEEPVKLLHGGNDPVKILLGV